MTCGGATIVPDEDSDGHHIVADPWAIAWHWEQRGKFREPASVFRGRIMTFMAGAEAEFEVLGACAGGDGDDRLQVAMMAEEIRIPERSGDAEADAAFYLDRLRRRTRAIVRRHRDAIHRVAGALAERHSLNPEEIDALVRG